MSAASIAASAASSAPPVPLPAVSCAGVSYTYGTRRALDSVSFTVGAGEIFGVLGRNGSGKTTLFRLLSTLVPLGIRSGTGLISLAGFSYPGEVAQARARLGVVFQSPSLDKKLTVEENINAHGHLYGLRGAELASRVAALLERFALTKRRRDLVETLSGGLQRRVEVAKSLVPRPAVLILDEPSTGLDPSARRELWDYLRALRQTEKLTILMTTHFLDEAEWCDRLLILDEGKTVALDTPEALKRRVGGAILTVQSKEGEGQGAEWLRDNLKRELNIDAVLRDPHLDIPVPGGKEAERDLINHILRRFRDEITSLTLSPPSLENVFTRLTGRAFQTTAPADEAPASAIANLQSASLPFMNDFSLAVTASPAVRSSRFLRQRNRVIGALATPLVFWFLIGSGVGKSFSGQSGSAAAGTVSYLHYFFPGTLLLIVLFTAIFSTISIIEDRREGFLQGVLVSPIPRSAFVWAKLIGGTLLSVAQCLVIYVLAVAMGLPFTILSFLLFLATLTVLGLALTGLGYLIAWPLDSTQGFHAIMNLVLMPLWFLSGALFRRGGSATWLQWLVACNPLSYGLALLRLSLEPGMVPLAGAPDPILAAGVTVAFAAVVAYGCIWLTDKIVVRNP